jgi:hypothetical protein
MPCQIVATDIGIIRQPDVTPSTAEKFRQKISSFLTTAIWCIPSLDSWVLESTLQNLFSPSLMRTKK